MAEFFKNRLMAINNTFNTYPDVLSFALVGTLMLELAGGDATDGDTIYFESIMLAQGFDGQRHNWWFGGNQCSFTGGDQNEVTCTGATLDMDAVAVTFRRGEGQSGVNVVSIEAVDMDANGLPYPVNNVFAVLDDQRNFFRINVSIDGGDINSFVVDTGSTGIVAAANVAGLSMDEVENGTCETFSYSSSGNMYKGYLVKRNITISTPAGVSIAPTTRSPKYAQDKKGSIPVNDLPIFAVVDNCGSNAGSSGVRMMGIGFDRMEAIDSSIRTYVNAANPLLNAYSIHNRAVAQSLYITLDSFTDEESPQYLNMILGMRAVDFEQGYPALANMGAYRQIYLTDSTDVPGDLTPPTAGASLFANASQTKPNESGITSVRLLPDTGIGYAILSLSSSSIPCCTMADTVCPAGSDNTDPVFNTGGKISLTFGDNDDDGDGDGPTLTLPIIFATDGDISSPILADCGRFSLGHRSEPSPLINTGRRFFDFHSYFHSPTAKSDILIQWDGTIAR